MPFVAAYALGLTLAMSPGGVATPHQAADLLHSTHLSFTAEGVPVVTVGLMDRQTEVDVTAPSGLLVKLSGGGKGELSLPPGTVLRTVVVEGRPGETLSRVVLGGFGGGELAELAEAREQWEKRGLDLDVVELGSIIGFPGRILDNRRTLLVERGEHSTREAAEARAQDIDTEWPSEEPPSAFTQPVRRATGRLVATDLRSGLRIAQDDLLSVRASDGGPVEVKKVEYGRGYAHHDFADRTYHGTIVLALDPTAKIAVVNRVSAEKLLQGLVPAETFPTAPAAALDVQAISARGELLAKVGVRHLADPYLVCATQHCQVYSGRSREKATTDAAVARTRGLMLFDAEDHLVDSVYSASCGGHTEHNEHVWRSPPSETLRGRGDAPDREGISWSAGEVPTEQELEDFIMNPPASFCGTTRFGAKVFRWRKTLPDAELDRLVNAKHDVGHVTAVEVLGRGVSGRALAVRFTGERGSVEVGPELPIRRLLGNLRSGMFVVERVEGRWSFVGGGWGHGVGMCQYGAIGMAERGFTPLQILRHYYKDSKVSEVY